MTEARVAGTVTCIPGHPLQATRVPALKFIKIVDFPLTVTVPRASAGTTFGWYLVEAVSLVDPQPAAAEPSTASNNIAQIGFTWPFIAEGRSDVNAARRR